MFRSSRARHLQAIALQSSADILAGTGLFIHVTLARRYDVGAYPLTVAALAQICNIKRGIPHLTEGGRHEDVSNDRRSDSRAVRRKRFSAGHGAGAAVGSQAH